MKRITKILIPLITVSVFSATNSFSQSGNYDHKDSVGILSNGFGNYNIISGQYVISFNVHHDYIRINRQGKNKFDNFLALKPGGDGGDFNILKEDKSRSVGCSEDDKKVMLRIKGKLKWCDYIFELVCPKNEPGLINSRVYIQNVLQEMQPKELFEGQYPELQYRKEQKEKSSNRLPNLVYYFNGTPGSYTYHTVLNDSSEIYDLNQFIYFGDRDGLQSTLQYYVDFTSLNPFFKATGTKILNTVRQPYKCMESPEKDLSGAIATFGFDIPQTSQRLNIDSPLLISNSFIRLCPGVPSIYQPSEFSTRFINGISALFPYLAKPDSKFIDWPEIVEQGIGDLISSSKETKKIAIFPQANLVSIRSYIEKFGSEKAKAFRGEWDDNWKILNFKLPYSDAWQYLYPLIQAGEYQAKFKSETAKKIFLNAADDVIHAGQKLNYRFPLRITADFSRSKEIRYEYDCTGAYVYLMILYYKETNQDKFLTEAKAAANELLKMGAEYPYEFTTTSVGPLAMLRLYKITNQIKYLKGISIPLAAILRHSWLFNPQYGVYNGRTIFMLTEAMPGVYANGWEEASLIHYLKKLLEEGQGILPEQFLDLTAELLRWKSISAADALAPLLPDQSIIYSGIPREWVMKVNKNWYIPLEGFGYLEWDDTGLHNQPGRVSQSPYCFGMLPEAAMLQFHKLAGDVQLYVEGPIMFNVISSGKYSFKMLAKNGTYSARIKAPKDRSTHVLIEEVLDSGNSKIINSFIEQEGGWLSFAVKAGIEYIIEQQF
jgi:hypothetical protein